MYALQYTIIKFYRIDYLINCLLNSMCGFVALKAKMGINGISCYVFQRTYSSNLGSLSRGMGRVAA